MNNKIILAILIGIFAIGLVFFIRVNQGSNNFIESSNNSVLGLVVQSNNSLAQELNGINIKSLSEHNNKEDCWIVYQNKVYDITSFLPRHPGGIDKIAQFCGSEEFESAFVKKHGNSKVSMLMKVGTFIGDFDIKGSIQ